MYTKSCNVEIAESDETDEVIEKLFDSFLTKFSNKFRRTNERMRVCF